MSFFTSNWTVSKNHDTDYVVHNADPQGPRYKFKTREWADLCAKRLQSLDFPGATVNLNNASLTSIYTTTASTCQYDIIKTTLTIVNDKLKNPSKVRLFDYVEIRLPVKRKSIRGFFVNCFFKMVFGATLEDNNNG